MFDEYDKLMGVFLTSLHIRKSYESVCWKQILMERNSESTEIYEYLLPYRLTMRISGQKKGKMKKKWGHGEIVQSFLDDIYILWFITV